MPDYFLRGFQPQDYEEDLLAGDDLAALGARLTALGVRRVLAGTESGVLIADRLNALMGLPGNDAGTAAARRDKTAMARAAAAAGLAVPCGRSFDDPIAAAAWYDSAGLREAVVKPPCSAGTDNVWFCSGAREVERACDRVLSASNLYGARNRAVLVQERLRGVEYYVNTVSHDGVHRIAETWRYHKRSGSSGSPVYDYEEPVPAAGAEAAPLRAYVPRVLDALGVVSGAAHTEVMVTERGPVLIESGARLGGATLPEVVEKFSGVSQTSLLADCVLSPDRLRAFDDTTVCWSSRVRNVALINHQAGDVRSLDWAERIAGLPTAVGLAHHLEPGQRLEPTRDLLDSPGFVYLAAADPAEVELDYALLREWEDQALYTS